MSKKSQIFGSPFNLNARNELKTPKRKSNLLQSQPQSRATHPTYPSRLFTTHSNTSTNASAQCQPMCSHNNNNKSQTHGIPQQQHHCQLHHSFISDITDVRQMENTLLQLLDDFHSGKLQAFGQDITFEKMESVREQQETLAKLHFDLNLQQEVYGHQTEEGRRMAKDNMSKLIENLQQLSNSIEQLQSRSSSNTGS